LAKLFHFGYIIVSTLVLHACEAKDNDANGARDVPWSLHGARSWGVLGPSVFFESLAAIFWRMKWMHILYHI